MLKDG